MSDVQMEEMEEMEGATTLTPETSSAIDAKRIINVTWPQLPQRDIWKTTTNTASSKNDDGEDLEMQNKPKKKRSEYGIHEVHEPVEKTAAGECEYLDHTADVQLHAWGDSRAEAYAASIVGLHAYMVEAPEVSTTHACVLKASGHDEHSLLYAILDEALFLFASEGFVIKHASVEHIDVNNEEKGKELKCIVRVWGFYFKQGVHAQGTEVKAITYSNMQVVEKEGALHLYVIVDI